MGRVGAKKNGNFGSREYSCNPRCLFFAKEGACGCGGGTRLPMEIGILLAETVTRGATFPGTHAELPMPPGWHIFRGEKAADFPSYTCH